LWAARPGWLPRGPDEYSPGYIADHWCSKGHILLCVHGELITELEDDRRYLLTSGMSYQVADHDAPHRSSSTRGATLLIVVERGELTWQGRR